MTALLIGNTLSLLGSLVMVYIGLVREKSRVLLLQCIQFVLLALANVVLGGYTGAISDVCSLLRNLVCFFFPYTMPVKLFFIAAQVVPTYFANQVGWLGWLPAASTCVFTWFMDLENELHFKLLLLITQLFWCVYDLYFRNYAAFTFDVFTLTTCTISLLRLAREQRSTKAKQDPRP